MGSGKRCRSQTKLADRAQRPQARIYNQWVQVTKARATVQATRNAMADGNNLIELQEMVRRQIKDVRKRSQELEERCGKHQRELETVLTANFNPSPPPCCPLTRFRSSFCADSCLASLTTRPT